ncbi:MAG: hypothetical protein RLY86_2165 [Pseudomonadota bacterium]|jgi:hypothetical protein
MAKADGVTGIGAWGTGGAGAATGAGTGAGTAIPILGPYGTTGPRLTTADGVTDPALVAAGAGQRLVFDLDRTEQLLLWSARRWRHGRFRWAEVEGEFKRHLGRAWADALMPWDMVLEVLHRLPLGQPEIRNGCATALSVDESALLRLVALAQRRTSRAEGSARADGPSRRGGAERVSRGFLLARLAPPRERADLAEWLDLTAAALPPLPLG